jgi:hypothetical protein
MADNLVTIERITIRGMGASERPSQYIKVPVVLRQEQNTKPGDVVLIKRAPGSNDVYISIEKQKGKAGRVAS